MQNIGIPSADSSPQPIVDRKGDVDDNSSATRPINAKLAIASPEKSVIIISVGLKCVIPECFYQDYQRSYLWQPQECQGSQNKALRRQAGKQLSAVQLTF